MASITRTFGMAMLREQAKIATSSYLRSWLFWIEIKWTVEGIYLHHLALSQAKCWREIHVKHNSGLTYIAKATQLNDAGKRLSCTRQTSCIITDHALRDILQISKNKIGRSYKQYFKLITIWRWWRCQHQMRLRFVNMNYVHIINLCKVFRCF